MRGRSESSICSISHSLWNSRPALDEAKMSRTETRRREKRRHTLKEERPRPVGASPLVVVERRLPEFGDDAQLHGKQERRQLLGHPAVGVRDQRGEHPRVAHLLHLCVLGACPLSFLLFSFLLSFL